MPKPPLASSARPAKAAAARALLPVLVSLLAGCIVVPQTQTVYDPHCRVETRQVTLQAAYLGGFRSCMGEGCAAMLATMGVVTAASVVVSGSIALVGNVVYFIERQGRCERSAPRPATLPATPPAELLT